MCSKTHDAQACQHQGVGRGLGDGSDYIAGADSHRVEQLVLSMGTLVAIVGTEEHSKVCTTVQCPGPVRILLQGLKPAGIDRG